MMDSFSTQSESEHSAEPDDDYTDWEERLEPPRRRETKGSKRRRRAKRGRTGEIEEGVVIERSRRNCRVESSSSKQRICYFAGRLRENEKPVVGDNVRIRTAEDDEGVLEEILPRKNTLKRVAEGDGGKVRTIAANIDKLFAVLTVDPFPPRWALADRLLALCELETFNGGIVVNKMDLLEDVHRRDVAEAADVYRQLGVPVYSTSALDGQGVEGLDRAMQGCINVFSGHSGVGKSSLLNAIDPEWKLSVGAVNPITSKGRHTTSAARLLKLPSSGYVVDTPGFREFGLGDIDPEALGRCYPEFRPIIGRCRFADCLHMEEPGCALRQALKDGTVSSLRYGNYTAILAGLKAGDGSPGVPLEDGRPDSDHRSRS